jgi:hypothetical protein
MEISTIDEELCNLYSSELDIIYSLNVKKTINSFQFRGRSILGSDHFEDGEVSRRIPLMPNQPTKKQTSGGVMCKRKMSSLGRLNNSNFMLFLYLTAVL